MRIQTFVLIHYIDEKGKNVSIHPSLRAIYYELCRWYDLQPKIAGVSDITSVQTLDRMVTQTGIASVMQDHDDGYEIFDFEIDPNQYFKIQE